MKCAVKTRLKLFIKVDRYRTVCERRFSNNLSYMNREPFILRTSDPYINI